MNTPANQNESKLAWSEESLILFYYNELTTDESEVVKKDLKNCKKLQQQYQLVCELLDDSLTKEIPKTSRLFNQNIMAAVYRAKDEEIAKSQATEFSKPKINKASFLSAFNAIRLPKLTLSFAVMAMLGIMFYVGRWSASPELDRSIVENGTTLVNETVGFTELQRERVLRVSLNQHIDSGSRLLTAVSNGNGDLANQMQQRRQFIEELISFNRMYRRIIENSGDKQLAHTLFQMESLLIEIKNVTGGPSVDSGEMNESLHQIQERLISSDLLFKLRVSEKRPQQNKI